MAVGSITARTVSPLLAGTVAQRLRLGAGLILLAYAATHFLNHAAGLFGIEALEAGQTLRFHVTRSWAGSIILAAAFLIHVAFGLIRLAERSTLRMPVWEATQVITGLLIPLLLIDHIVGTRGASLAFGTNDFYRPVLAVIWPEHAFRQSLLLVLVWAHGMIGLHHWLKTDRRYHRLKPWLLGVAVAIPALALAGFVTSGREVTAMLADQSSRTRLLASYGFPDAAGEAVLEATAGWIRSLYLIAVATALGTIAVRSVVARQRPMVEVTYAGGPTVRGPIGATLLEIARSAGVPHASQCGGRARCSTCRVRIDRSERDLQMPAFAEATTLGAIRAPSDVRLACQLRPQGTLTVTRLVAPPLAGERLLTRIDDAEASGVERHLAVMFLDLKGFTGLAEKRLPYDVVYLLNRFFAAIGAAIAAEGGWIDKYMGDGLLAVFGRETGLTAGARSALAAAVRIDLALEKLAKELAAEGLDTIGIGIGLHAGPLIVGRIGYRETAGITVIGATVNLASRLESLTREKGCQLIVSRALADAADWDGGTARTETVTVRGQTEPVEILLVDTARSVKLPAV